MPSDALLTLQSSVTKTGTFNGTGLNIGTMTPRRGLWAVIRYSAASVSASTGSVTFRLTTSSDNSSYSTTEIFQNASSVVALSTTATSGLAYIPFNTDKPYVRLEISAMSGTDATITYNADISLTKP